jgi:hypothetical protein
MAMDHEHLVRRASGGDVEAFVELTHRFQHFTFGSALALVRDFRHTEDVMQERPQANLLPLGASYRGSSPHVRISIHP